MWSAGPRQMGKKKKKNMEKISAAYTNLQTNKNVHEGEVRDGNTEKTTTKEMKR